MIDNYNKKIRKILLTIAKLPILPEIVIYYIVQNTLMYPFYKYKAVRLGAMLTHIPILIAGTILLGIFANRIPIWLIILSAINIVMYFISGFIGLVILDSQI